MGSYGFISWKIPSRTGWELGVTLWIGNLQTLMKISMLEDLNPQRAHECQARGVCCRPGLWWCLISGNVLSLWLGETTLKWHQHAKRHSPKAVAGYDLLHVLSSLHLDILATHKNRLIADGTSPTRDQNYPLHHHESTKWATLKISTIWCGTQEFERWCSQSEIVMFGFHIACQESDMCAYNIHGWSFLVVTSIFAILLKCIWLRWKQ